MISPRPEPSLGRLVDCWPGDHEREPLAVVAELRAKAPAWLRSRIRPMTDAERRLWRYFGDREWMGAEVFSQVPLYLPEANRGFILGFLIPASRVAVQVVPRNPGSWTSALADAMEQDDLVRDRAGIATMRCIEDSVLRDPLGAAEGIRWTLGLGGCVDGFLGINLPRP